MISQTTNFKFPYVTIDEALSYDPKYPETATKSPLVNALIEAFTYVRPLTPDNVQKFIGVERKHWNGALYCALGMNYNKFLTQWRIKKIYEMEGNPEDLTSDEIGKKLGFADRSSLWLFMKNNKILKKKSYNEGCMFEQYKNPIYQNKKHRK